MTTQNKYADDGTMSLLDLVLFMAAFFFLMFSLSIIYMNVKQPDAEKVKLVAAFRITTSWDNDDPCDIDTWLADPSGHLVMWGRKEDGLMHLDRDDIGHSDDTVTLPNGDIIKYSENRENITIRGIIPGEYVLNLHMYNDNGAKFPVDAKVVLFNVKESREEHSETVGFKFNGEEKTAFRFTLTASGKVININRLQKKYVGRPE